MVAAIVACSWRYLVVPMLLRPFGYKLPFGFSRKNDRSQEWEVGPFVLIIGVLGCGWGFAIFFAVRDSLRWWLQSGEKPSPVGFLIGLAATSIAGALVGYLQHERS